MAVLDMNIGICEGSSMVSCVVRGLSRSMVGGARLSYRHMIRRWGFQCMCSQLFKGCSLGIGRP